MGDLKSPGLICLKAGLFLICGMTAAFLLVVQTCRWDTVFLLAVTIWSCCRLYYFLFYVVEHYVDPNFNYSGLLPMLKHLWMNYKKS
jgi:hypothetical protein